MKTRLKVKVLPKNTSQNQTKLPTETAMPTATAGQIVGPTPAISATPTATVSAAPTAPVVPTAGRLNLKMQSSRKYVVFELFKSFNTL